MSVRTIFVVAMTVLLGCGGLQAQSFRQGGTEFEARRDVRVEKPYPVVVTQFFHHGQITPDGRNLLVVDRQGKPVPVRLLQLGPGDFCRLAFQAVGGEGIYQIYYGGEPPRKDVVPQWTSRDGLLLETRQYRQCNLGRLDSVRRAFESAKPIGADYVPAVRHSCNPFALRPAPFLSRYSGYLQIAKAGRYGFITSSQDASFLLIDGAEVVSAPGRHRPMRRARRGSRKDVELSAGRHKFEYYHAATSPTAMMVVAWEISPTDPKPRRPKGIPPELFRSGSIGRLPTRPVTMRSTRLVPDFLLRITGDVPLPDEPQPLVGVAFENISLGALTIGGKTSWDFGDGQTSNLLSPTHVYLRPGLYTVKLMVRRGGKIVETANRVLIDRPLLTRKDKLHALDDYLPILDTYDPHTLDAASLRQLVLAYQWKSETSLIPQTDAEKKPATPKKPPRAKKPSRKKRLPRPKQPQKQDSQAEEAQRAEARKAESLKYIGKAVEVGKVAFLEKSAAQDGVELHKLVCLVGPMVRDRLGDSQLALKIWQQAAQKIAAGPLRAECEMEAADISINDLLAAARAKPLLEAASAHLGMEKKGPVASRLHLTWGDYYALTGDGEAAREAYSQAEQVLGSTRSHTERTAWLGAHSRSAEEFLRTGEWDRALKYVRLWQEEFPAEKIDGYLTLTYARYWAGREKYAQAIAQTEQLLAVNAGSPYADQSLWLAADCELKRDRPDRALATLHSLLKDYPGSPLVEKAKAKIAGLEAGETGKPKKRPR